MRQYTPFLGLLAALTACQAGELEPTADEVPDAGAAPVTAPQGNVNPPQRTLLGTADVGATVTKTIEVPYHPGASADNVTISGADADQFSVEDVDCVEGGNCTYTVAFSPDAAGAKSALLSLGTGEGVVPLSKVTGVGLPTKILANQTLVVQKGVDEVANGRGSVFEVPDQLLYCDADCDATMQSYPQGALVTLRAVPELGNTFIGWGGACSGTASDCTVTMNGLRAVTATFRGTTQLTVQPLGAAGVITSADGQLTCGTDCQHVYPTGSQVLLSYQLPAGISFAGWDGVCSGAGMGPCTVTMSQDTNVAAHFRNVVTVVKSGTGTEFGTIVSKVGTTVDGQITCGSDCTGDYPTSAQSIVLEASAPAESALFDSWVGCPSPSGNKCTLTVNRPTSVTAVFRVIDTVSFSLPEGGGSLKVQSGGQEQTCTGTCEYRVPRGHTITARAVPVDNKTFDRWDGQCRGASKTCTLTVNGGSTSGAYFQHRWRIRATSDWRPPKWRVGNGAWQSFTYTTRGYIKDFDGATTVQVTQTPTRDTVNCMQFTGMSGDCNGTGICTLNVSDLKLIHSHWTEIGGCTPQ
jgi:hypothetical protein